MFKKTFHSDEPLIKDYLLSCTSEFCWLTSISLNYTIMVSFRSIRRRDIRRQETASVKDFSSYTSKKKLQPRKLTTVLLNGNHFSPGCWFLRNCHNSVSKVASCFWIWRQSQLVRTLDLDYLRVKQTNIQTKKLSALFVRYAQFPTTLCICIISPPPGTL